MSFSALPNEILHEIAGFVQPEDLENFAQTSKQVYHVVQPFLPEHRRLIRQYRSFRSPGPLNPVRDGVMRGPIPELLRAVLDNPRIGHYVREVELGKVGRSVQEVHQGNGAVWTYHDSSEYGCDDEGWQERLFEQIDLFQNAASQSKFLAKTEVDDLGELYIDVEDITAALLLTLLPNLTTLALEWQSIESPCYQRILERAPKNTAPLFFNLRNVKLTRGSDNSHGIHIEQLNLFSAIPSLRSLTASDTYETNGCWEDPLPPGDSHITDLVLRASRVGTKTIYEFLQSFHNLESFDFEYVVPHHMVFAPFDPFLLRAALLSQAKATLRKLTILGDRGTGSFMGSLRSFQVLSEIYTDWSSLYLDSDDWPSRVLPASLRTLNLRDRLNRSTNRCANRYGSLVQSFVSAKATAVPSFEVLEVTEIDSSAETYWENNLLLESMPSLRSECEKAGISASFYRGQFQEN